MTKPSFAIAVTFRIHPQHVDAFRTRVMQQARDSVEREPGCHQFDVLVDESDASVVFLYETYTDAEAFAEHRTTPHFLDFAERVEPWVASKSLVRLNHLSQ